MKFSADYRALALDALRGRWKTAVLAGLIAAFAAQGIPSWEAACAGVYLHGLAGDAAAAALSQQAMLPRDLLAYLPQVLVKLEQER